MKLRLLFVAPQAGGGAVPSRRSRRKCCGRSSSSPLLHDEAWLRGEPLGGGPLRHRRVLGQIGGGVAGGDAGEGLARPRRNGRVRRVEGGGS